MEDLQKQALIRIVDDDESLLFSTQIYLEALGWKVVTYNNAVDFLNRDNLNLPGCLILDVRMPRMTGLELQELLESRGFAHFPIIFLSGHGDIEMAVHTMSHGAVTFLEKPADPEKLAEAVKKAVSIGIKKGSAEKELRDLRRKFNSLTPREVEVIKLVSKGLSNKEIAESLNVALTTVKMHRGNAVDKLEVHSAAEITKALVSLGEAL